MKKKAMKKRKTGSGDLVWLGGGLRWNVGEWRGFFGTFRLQEAFKCLYYYIRVVSELVSLQLSSCSRAQPLNKTKDRHRRGHLASQGDLEPRFAFARGHEGPPSALWRG